jgi:hypothetical protein
MKYGNNSDIVNNSGNVEKGTKRRRKRGGTLSLYVAIGYGGFEWRCEDSSGCGR